MQEPIPAFQASPLVHYPLDQSTGTSVTDSSIYGRTGTIYNNTAPLWQAGNFGNALTFDGTNDYVASPAFASPTSSVTVACWARSGTATNWNTWGGFVAKRPSFASHR